MALSDEDRKRIYEEEKERQKARDKIKYKRAGIGCLGILGIGVFVGLLVFLFGETANEPESTNQAVVAAPTSPPARKPIPEATQAPPPTPAPPTPTPAPPTPTPTPTGPATAFGDGIHIVGTDIVPGTYIVPNEDNRCFWSRLAGFSGQLDDIIANANPTGQSIVAIDPEDAGFESSRCGEWVLLSDIATGEPASTFDSGTFAVGSHIRPGTYRTDGTDRCYWTRLSGFGGTLDNIVANGNPRAQVIVEIAPTDVGFESARCGTWVRIGD